MGKVLHNEARLKCNLTRECINVHWIVCVHRYPDTAEKKA